jgi:hypothetical protein
LLEQGFQPTDDQWQTLRMLPSGTKKQADAIRRDYSIALAIQDHASGATPQEIAQHYGWPLDFVDLYVVRQANARARRIRARLSQ